MASLGMPSRRAVCGALWRAIVFTALAISCPEAGRALEPASDALLKDAAAAADANGALIQHGTAKYRIISKDFRSVGGRADGARLSTTDGSRVAKQKAKTGEPMAADVTVYFDYPNRLRFDWRGQRVAAGSNAGEIVESLEWTIYDKGRKIHYSLIYGAHMILGSDPSVRPSNPRA